MGSLSKFEPQLVADDLDDDLRLYLGAKQDGTLLEVVTLMRQEGTEIAIHAMAMRAKYRSLLPGGS